MARSGIEADQDSKDMYNALHRHRKVEGVRLKWIMYTINSDRTTIIIEKKSGDTDYDSFLEEFPAEEPRFAVYDFEYDLGDAGKRNKIVFIHWNPTIPEIPGEAKAERAKRTAPLMLFATSKAQFIHQLATIDKDMHATELDDISYEAVLDKVKTR